LRVINLDDHVAHELARASFTLQRRWLRLLTLAFGLLTCLAVLLTLLADVPWKAALALGGFLLLSGAGLGYFEWRYRRQSRRRSRLQAGLDGQRFLTEILSCLDDRYYLINNLDLPGRADDVDHVVIGPNGLFALETKNHRGRIFYHDGQWLQSKMSRNGHLQPEEPIRDPTQQLKRNVDYMRSCINHTDRALSRRTRLWIEGAVVFTHPAVSLDLPESVLADAPFSVLRARDLPAHISRHTPRRSYTKAEIRQIVSLLGNLLPSPSGH